MKLAKKVLIMIVAMMLFISIVLLWIFRLPAPPVALEGSFQIGQVTVINPMLNRMNVGSLSVVDGKIEVSDHATRTGTYDGGFVLPGLVNMHSHSPSQNLLQLSPMFALAAIMHGVTSWRDAIDADGTGVPALRGQIKQGIWPTPDVFSCAVITKGEGRWPNSNYIEMPSQAEALIKSLKDKGYSCLKSYENLSSQLILAIVEQAKKHDMQVIGHVPEGLSIEQASLPDNQHLFGVAKENFHSVIDRNGNWESVDDERIFEVKNYIVDNELATTPTLVTLKQIQNYADLTKLQDSAESLLLPSFYFDVIWHPKHGLPVYRNLGDLTIKRAASALAKKQSLIRALHEAGATINLGTDTQQPFVVPGMAMWQEMRLFEDAGIPAEEIWAHATWKARRQLADNASLAANQLGDIHSGAEATFLIFSEDPSKSLAALESLQAVVIRGVLYDMDELNKSMKSLKDHYESWPVKVLSSFFAAKAMNKIASKFTH